MTLLWIETTLEEIADIQTGSTPSKKNSQFYGGSFPLFKPGDLGSIYPLSYSDECLSDEGKAVARFIPANSTYVTCIGATIGKTGFVNVDATCNQQINTLTPLGGIVPKLVFYWMISPQMNHQIINGSSSTTMPIINKSRFSKLHCVLPPFAEQKVIADKLDTLLAQVETTKARLERIPEILKCFRQSVLAAAVSGKLTEEWRGPSIVERQFKKLGDSGIEVKTGPFGSALHKSDYIVEGIPVINPMHIADGEIFPSSSMSISKEKFEELSAWHLRQGDVVIGRRGEMGRAAVYTSPMRMLCGTGSMILRASSDVLPKYLEMILRSPIAIDYFNSASVGSTMVNLNQKVIKELEVYFPDFKEQTEIVRRVEELFAFADSIEQKAIAALARVNNLTQSILAKAFRGELTAEWRAANPELISGDNSAAALLEKIKAERAALAPSKKSRASKKV
ncbi:restriction endonuclease subunit S [Shewanella algae]|uniref:restriction endonuclease subunit S n=1 Tax=Shewanella algae TaxID=38313 RepID=UPI000F42822B|nr:restriction endonuclease subunit S [Shewanella algae]AYV13214.1 restriction endonuclease subunit S [Shewanella algae]